jgi:catechol 2,3-dioxygenase-like lactoylglutathione lyase family enzyme
MGPTRVHHVAIKVADLARAEAFYSSLLGLPVLRRWPAADGGGERALWLDLGQGAFLALERADGAEAAKGEGAPGLHLLALAIARDERAAWEARLAQAGFPVYQRTDFTLYVRDPEGNRIGLSHWPARPSEASRVEGGGEAERSERGGGRRVGAEGPRG